MGVGMGVAVDVGSGVAVRVGVNFDVGCIVVVGEGATIDEQDARNGISTIIKRSRVKLCIFVFPYFRNQYGC
jgi:hypothetical protein